MKIQTVMIFQQAYEDQWTLVVEYFQQNNQKISIWHALVDQIWLILNMFYANLHSYIQDVIEHVVPLLTSRLI